MKKTKICPICNNEFEPTHYKQRFCKNKHFSKCEICGKEIEQKNLLNIKKACSKECRLKVRGKTNLEKFGVENPFSSGEIKEKIKQTNIKKYGAEHRLKNKSEVEKQKQSNILKYGVENPMQNKEILDKVLKTNLEKYGSKSPLTNHKVREKTKKTKIEKYGTTSHWLSEEWKNKHFEDNLKKYGHKLKAHTKEVREKANKSLRKTYSKNYLKFKRMILKRWGTKNIDDFIWFTYFFNNLQYVPSIEALANYFNRSESVIISLIKNNNLISNYPEYENYSTKERIVKEFLDENKIEYISQTRKIITPFELDFYLPDYNLAIEVSPTWTHKYITNENGVGVTDKEYHYNKFKLCENKGVELITIFDWHDYEKVFEMILAKTNTSKTIYARNTTLLIKQVDNEIKEFIKLNHILGDGKLFKRDIAVCLEYNNKIVGVGIYRKETDNVYELKRLAFKAGFTVIGGASKIFKNFLKEYPNISEIVTFSDNDLGSGSVYEKLGFELIEENKGQLQWHNENKEIKISNLSLVKQGSDRLLRKYDWYKEVGMGDNLPSNQEILEAYNFLPVIDCGYKKWSYKINKKENS